jgi:hypothetical protein
LIVGIILIYFAWSRGLIPVFGEASRAECESRLVTACGKGDMDEVTKLWTTCKNAYKGDTELQDQTNVNVVCSTLLARSRGQQTQ